jgi:outer membrane protein OmpA-like peptidoglycan-associated protein
MDARTDAMDAEAQAYAKEKWENAEEEFADAASELEGGSVSRAQKSAGKAEQLYRQAELDAIKVAYLDETLQLIENAEDKDVEDFAPMTLNRSRDLVEQAERELNQNRYDTDLPRNLAKQAKYEARHAMYLAEKISKMKKSYKEFEGLYLTLEEYLRQIAANIDIVAEFDEGFDKPVDQINEYIISMQNANQKLTQELSGLTEDVKDLQAQLGALSQEKTTLTENLERRAIVREQFVTVEKMFGPSEASVLRDVDDVIIRLIGLNFDSGSSVLKPQYFGILTKVKGAINTFPNCTVTVKGHTDSFGSDDTNLQLSQNRADAIMAYLLANMDLDPSRIEAIGLGETEPIANNETPEGRAKNRRIDIVIHP